MKWSIGAKIGGGFGLGLLILLIIGTSAYSNTTQLVADTTWVSHTHRVLEKLEELLSNLKDAETGQRGYLITGEERYLEPYDIAVGRLDKSYRDVVEMTKDNAVQQRRIEAFKGPLDARMALLKEIIELRRGAQGFDAARQLVLSDRGKTLMDELRRMILDMEAEENSLLNQRTEQSNRSVESALNTIVWGTVAAFVLLAVVGFFLTRNIARPLNEVSEIASRIAVGDINVRLTETQRTDEIGALLRSFARMVATLREMVAAAQAIATGDLRARVAPRSDLDVLGIAFATMVDNLRRTTADLSEAVNVLGVSASQILASTTQVASGAAETGTAIAQTTTTVEEVKQTALLSSQKAKYVSDNAQKATQIGATGRRSVEASITGIQRIQSQVEAIAESVVRMSEQSQAIGEIIATVNDLAEQSNLLAVNAAIEAAKAGEQGKGFAVVAQEVKSLAEQSKQATSQVRTILSDIQKATTAAVMATEQGSEAVEAGVLQTTEAGETIRQLVESLTEAAQAASQISASSQQQLVGTDQVALAMENIKQASAQNVAGTRQTETAARNLHELGQKMKLLVVQYKV
jgi:methyl-accepting chemotaxis protein